MVRHTSTSLRDGVAKELDEIKAVAGLSEYEVFNQAVSFARANQDAFMQFIGKAGGGVHTARMLADQQVKAVDVKMKDLYGPIDPAAAGLTRIDAGDSGKAMASPGEKPGKKKDQTQLR